MEDTSSARAYMKLHEYQAKSILAGYGMTVPRSGVATTPLEARGVMSRVGSPAVVKAQVQAGGRGKGGGIKPVKTAEEAEDAAAAMLGTRLVTPQTGHDGAPVNRVMVEESLEIERELYVGIVVDAAARAPVVIASSAGGMEIEEIARDHPELILREVVEPMVGLRAYQGRRLAAGMGLPPALANTMADQMIRLYRAFIDRDCTLAEINPLALTEDGQLLALDAKLDFEDDALSRHADVQSLRDTEQEEPLELEASKFDISYVKLDGDVGCMVNGAGLAMATMDSITMAEAMPANFLDVGGGASEEQVAQAFRLLLSDPQVKRILVNVFGGILRCDVAARGIVAAAEEAEDRVPIVVRMLGTNADEGKEILAQSNLGVTLVNDLNEAADAIRQAAG